MTREIFCPIDHVSVNENKIRLVAAQVCLFSIAYLWVATWELPAILVIDFFLRSFGFSKYSPLAITSTVLIGLLQLKNKPVDQAPKIFAAQMGFAFAVILFILSVLGLITLSYFVAGAMVLFSFLESALRFCAGCHAYSLMKRFS